MPSSVRTDSPDAIVTLQAVQDLSCSKTFSRIHDEITITSYGEVRTWIPEAVSVKSFSEFEATLKSLAMKQDRVIIRDALIDEDAEIHPEIGIVRRANGDTATFNPTPRRWVALDIDALVAPDELKEATQKELVQWTREQLPDMFQTAACWYQFTSSYLISTGPEVLRLRLWFLLDKPVDSKTWKTYFKGNALKIDTALFHPVQPHYIAAPRFRDMKPPILLKDRFGRLGGEPRVKLGTELAAAKEESERTDTRDLADVNIDGNEAQIQQRIDIILNQETTGSRHHHAFGAAAELLSVGCPVERIVETLKELLQSQGRDENAANEIRDIIIAAQEKQKAGQLKVSVKPINDLFADDFDEVNTGEVLTADEDVNFSEMYSSEANSMYNAKVFLARAHEGLGLIRWMQDDYQWNGRCWTTLELETLESNIAIDSQLASHQVSAIAKSIRQLMYRPGLVHRHLVSDPLKPISPYVVFNNGMLFMSDYLMAPDTELEPHNSAYFNPVSLPFNYDNEAQCPKFLKFIEDCFGDDDEQKRECQKMFGYLVSQGNNQQKFFMLQGPTRAGKGVMMSVLRGLMGEQNIASPLLARLDNEFAMAPLVKKSLIVIDEANEQSSNKITTTVVDLIKAVTGGSPLQINRKNRDVLDNVQLPGRFLIACNRPPAFLDPSGALGARLVMLRFAQSFVGREDPALANRLRGELPGIFNWALEGLRKLDIEDGRFITPAAVKEYLELAQDTMQPVQAFTKECVRLETAAHVTLPLSDLYAVYREWCVDNGRSPYSKQRLCSEIIHTLNVVKTRPRAADGSRSPSYNGLAFTPIGESYMKDSIFD